MLKAWKVLGLVLLVLVSIGNQTFAKPMGSEHYSVEEQDPAEQIDDADDKNFVENKPFYELQMAVWPENGENHAVVMADAPVFEEQEIAYPVMVPEQNVGHDVVNNVPTWHHTTQTTTERPTPQHVPVWQQTKPPVHISSTWQHAPTTENPVISDWHYQAVKPTIKPVHTEAVSVPVWQQHETSVPISNVPSVPVSIPEPAPLPAPTQVFTPQNELPAPIFPDIHFDEAEAIADQQDNADVANDHFLITVAPNKPKPTKRPTPHVEVIEQYQTVKPNGITEYKLVLSNGMTNYKKIYNKLLPSGKIVTVQEGYDSVPIPGDDPYSSDYQTQYYIADEFGHNVYRVEKHTRRPKLPSHLDYKEQVGKS